MGFLSKIGKGIKNVFGGIMKVFQPILEPVAKFLNTGLGKAIMIGLSIFTLGSAMIAAQGMYAATMASSGSFVQAFVAGGKQFFTTMLTGKGFEGAPAAPGAETVKAAAEGASSAIETGGAGALTEGTSIANEAAAEAAKISGNLEPVANVGAAAGEVAGAGAGAVGGSELGTQAMQATTNPNMLSPGYGDKASLMKPGSMAESMTKPGATSAGSQTTRMTDMAAQNNFGSGGDTGGWLSNAAKKAQAFAESEGGSNIIGKLIEGAGNYYTSKDQQEFDDRIRRQWGKGSADPGVAGIRETGDRYGKMHISRTAPSMGTVPGTNVRPRYQRQTAGAGG